ncbi:MAG: hypothetical protein ACKO11_13190 [Cuspidothrix sp.]
MNPPLMLLYGLDGNIPHCDLLGGKSPKLNRRYYPTKRCSKMIRQPDNLKDNGDFATGDDLGVRNLCVFWLLVELGLLVFT